MAYLDKGDLVIYSNNYPHIIEIRLKKVDSNKADKERAELAGLYTFSSITATMDGETKTVNVGDVDEEGYTYKPTDMLFSLWTDGTVSIYFSMFSVRAWGTWCIENGSVAITSEALQSAFETDEAVKFTIEGDKLIYQDEKDGLAGSSITLIKTNVH